MHIICQTKLLSIVPFIIPWTLGLELIVLFDRLASFKFYSWLVSRFYRHIVLSMRDKHLREISAKFHFFLFNVGSFISLKCTKLGYSVSCMSLSDV